MSKPTTGWKQGRKTINGHEYVLEDYYSWRSGVTWVVRSNCGEYRLPREFCRRADACNAAQAHAEAGGWPPPKPKPICRATYDVYAEGEPCKLWDVDSCCYFMFDEIVFHRPSDCSKNGYPANKFTIVQPVRLERVK